MASGQIYPGTPLQSYSDNTAKTTFNHYNGECKIDVIDFEDVYFVGESIKDWFGINASFPAQIENTIHYKCFM
jgi:hypothetical protein